MSRRSSRLPAVALGLLAVAAPFVATGCVSVKTAPIEVKPVHITVDVNVRVDKALDDFFDDIDKTSTTVAAPKEEPKS